MESEKVHPITALDTSVIIAGLFSWHVHHEAAAAELAEILSESGKVVLPLQALVEAYSVMTRLPSPHRLSAKDALAALEGSFRQRTIVVGLEGDEVWELVEDLCRHQIAGGASYDGVIASCARKGVRRRSLPSTEPISKGSEAWASRSWFRARQHRPASSGLSEAFVSHREPTVS